MSNQLEKIKRALSNAGLQHAWVEVIKQLQNSMIKENIQPANA